MSQQPSFLELVMDRGLMPGLKFSLTQTSATIGRAADNDFVIDDPEISRHHTRLTWDGQQLIVEDLGSANGTFVNSVCISGPTMLRPGDVLGLGQTVAFRLAAPQAMSPSAPQVSTAFAPPPPGKPSWVWMSIVALLSLCICAAAVAAAGYYWRQRQNVTVPSVSITSPRTGARVEVGQPVAIDLVAYDAANKVTRVELWVDGRLRETRNSGFPEGMSLLPLSVDWRPESAGTHTLAARAYNRQGRRGYAAISVEANETPDRDRDGIRDPEDACPDEAGQPSANGCPDRDLDGVPDNTDACPDQAGVPERNGCPNPQADDRDGDGVLDAGDACPDDIGPAWTRGCPDRDSDGVRDDGDACPDQWGLPEYGGCPPPDDRDADGAPDAEDACPDEEGRLDADGCPDRDGDSIGDRDDACPDDWGPPELSGCPDRDGDGVPDRQDACPDDPGPPELHGCPDTGAGDRDDDGVPDDFDPAPDEPGAVEDGGAPAPGEGTDADDDGVADADELPEDPLDGVGPFPDMGGEAVVWSVQLEALEFEVDRGYHEVYCYAGVVGREMEHFGPFEPAGERRWDIAEVLAGENSVTLRVHDGEPLSLQIEGAAQDVFWGEDGGWGTYYDLGQIIRDHPESDWDGHVITARSEGADGRWFQVKYRLCRDSCEEAAFPPPHAWLTNFPDYRVMWTWGGNEADVDGFKLYKDGNVVIAPIRRDARWQTVRFLEPACGRRVIFNVTAYRGGRESPFSNNATWTTPACPRTVQVTFETISTGVLRCEGIGCSSRLGGHFWAVGSDGRQELRFESQDLLLASMADRNVQEIFDEIIRQWESCIGSGCPDTEAPETNSIIVELGPYDDLTFGGKIEDGDGTLFEGERMLRARDTLPGEYTIHNREITLHVLVDVLVGPSAGGGRFPDLTISDVTAAGPGRIAIHLFNNAADMERTDVEINLVRRSENASIGVFTWQDVSIPSGGEEILVSEDLGLEPYDLRVIVDPANRINEGPEGEGNNVYETPVVMRVEFLSASTGHCNENCCSIFDCDSEFVYRLWVGHGPSRPEAEWVAHNLRFPQSDSLVACGHDICRDNASPDEAWRMEGDPRYIFEFEMPLTDNLYVEAAGYEQDVFNNDDSLGYISYSYTPHQNWGARPAEYQDSSREEDNTCDDTFCCPCHGDLSVRWRIARVH